MLVKSIKKRLPAEFVTPVTSMCELMGFPSNTDRDALAKTRSDFSAVRTQALAMGAEMTGTDKLAASASNADDGFEVPLFVYSPSENAEALPLLFWIHGGGLVLGHAEQDEVMLRNFATDFNCVVVTPDYRLAPDVAFPAPLEDCYAGLKWAANHLDIDPKRIVIAGASAGGGLAAALTQLACDRGEIAVKHQLLLYPMLDPLNITQAGDDIDDTYIWSRKNNLQGWTYYLGQAPEEGKIPQYASALYNHDLSNLPPATVMVGDIDLFAQEDIAYAAKLSAAGVPTELHVYPGGIHGFEGIKPDAQISKNFLAARDSALRAALGD